MENIAVVINKIIVHAETETIRGTSMMLAHRLRKFFCIDQLKANGVDAGVWVEREGRMIEAAETRLDENILVVGSQMNAEGFEPESSWYDDFFAKKDK